MADTVVFSADDNGSENTSMTVHIADITAANHDATVTAIATLRNAMLPLMKGGWDKSAIREVTYDTPVPNTDPYAQREIKWAIIVQGISGDPYLGNEMPMANLDLLESGSEYIIKNGDIVVDDTGGDIADFVTAYEALATNQAGGAIVIKDMYFVGRAT